MGLLQPSVPIHGIQEQLFLTPLLQHVTYVRYVVGNCKGQCCAKNSATCCHKVSLQSQKLEENKWGVPPIRIYLLMLHDIVVIGHKYTPLRSLRSSYWNHLCCFVLNLFFIWYRIILLHALYIFLPVFLILFQFFVCFFKNEFYSDLF